MRCSPPAWCRSPPPSGSAGTPGRSSHGPRSRWPAPNRRSICPTSTASGSSASQPCAPTSSWRCTPRCPSPTTRRWPASHRPWPSLATTSTWACLGNSISSTPTCRCGSSTTAPTLTRSGPTRSQQPRCRPPAPRRLPRRRDRSTRRRHVVPDGAQPSVPARWARAAAGRRHRRRPGNAGPHGVVVNHRCDPAPGDQMPPAQDDRTGALPPALPAATARRMFIFGGLFAGLLVAASCGSGEADSDADTTGASSGAADDIFPVAVEHACGRTEIDRRPVRVVSVGEERPRSGPSSWSSSGFRFPATSSATTSPRSAPSSWSASPTWALSSGWANRGSSIVRSAEA